MLYKKTVFLPVTKGDFYVCLSNISYTNKQILIKLPEIIH